MTVLEAIATRRSIRRFQDRTVPRELIERVLEAGTQAPSAKNTQPWRFIVLEGERNRHLAQMMLDAAAYMRSIDVPIGSLEGTARAMLTAPVTILVLNEKLPSDLPERARRVWHSVLLQSTGAAIQTMLLAATEMGLGSLWIGDVLSVEDEALGWLEREEATLVAAVTLGYAEGDWPTARPRHPWHELTDWHPGDAG